MSSTTTIGPDKLSLSLYEKGDEVLQDYGLARFVNIEQKGGGNHPRENTTWAKQTITHNTIVQNETSHFQGSYEIGSRHHPELQFYDASNDDIQVVSAVEVNAYPGTVMRRTMAMIKNDEFEKPFLLDVMKVDSDKEDQCDLPYHFLGQAIQANFEYGAPSELRALGKENGYQRLYSEGVGKPTFDNSKLTWMGNRKFYTLTSATIASDELLFTRIGANDPEFNLRRDPAFCIRRKDAKSTVFASIVEPHGSYCPVSESALNSKSSISGMKVVYDDRYYTAVTIEDVLGSTGIFITSNMDTSATKAHDIEIDDKAYHWKGPYHYADK